MEVEKLWGELEGRETALELWTVGDPSGSLEAKDRSASFFIRENTLSLLGGKCSSVIPTPPLSF